MDSLYEEFKTKYGRQILTGNDGKKRSKKRSKRKRSKSKKKKLKN